jgi:hypothetical protein
MIGAPACSWFGADGFAPGSGRVLCESCFPGCNSLTSIVFE